MVIIISSVVCHITLPLHDGILDQGPKIRLHKRQASKGKTVGHNENEGKRGNQTYASKVFASIALVAGDTTALVDVKLVPRVSHSIAHVSCWNGGDGVMAI